jgi:hypothetical protein
MPGQGFCITSQPPSPCCTGWPAASTICGTTPGSGSVQLPGFVGVQLDRLLHAVFLQQPNVPEQRVRDPISSP